MKIRNQLPQGAAVQPLTGIGKNDYFPSSLRDGGIQCGRLSSAHRGPNDFYSAGSVLPGKSVGAVRGAVEGKYDLEFFSRIIQLQAVVHLAHNILPLVVSCNHQAHRRLRIPLDPGVPHQKAPDEQQKRVAEVDVGNEGKRNPKYRFRDPRSQHFYRLPSVEKRLCDSLRLRVFAVKSSGAPHSPLSRKDAKNYQECVCTSNSYSTVTLFARLRGLSTPQPTMPHMEHTSFRPPAHLRRTRRRAGAERRLSTKSDGPAFSDHAGPRALPSQGLRPVSAQLPCARFPAGRCARVSPVSRNLRSAGPDRSS